MFTVLLVKYLDREKYDPVIGVPTDGPICRYFKSNNIKYFIFNNNRVGKHTLSGIKYLFKNIRENRYDIIHAQAGTAPCLIGRLLRTPLIIEHRHGLDFTSEAIRNMSFAETRYEKLKKYLSDYSVTVCKSDRTVLIEKFGYDKDKVFTVYNGIEDHQGNPDKNEHVKKIIGTVGRLTYQKAQEYLIESARDLIKKGYDFEFHIYGDGEERDKYQDLIQSYGLEESVKLMGYTDDVYAVLKSFDLFVLPSRYEGIPYVILEAMSLGIPLISTDVGGISEVIRNGENGLLIQKENSGALSENIIRLMENEDLRKRLKENARSDYEKFYNIKKTVGDIEAIYSRI